MSEQIIDLRSTWAILRRRMGVLIVVTLLGAGLGAAAVSVTPPSYSSTSIVLLPPPQGANGTTPDHSIDTQVQIANSEAVLGPAGTAVLPQLSEAEVASRAQVTAPTTDVLNITASGATAAAAEALSQAIAQAEVAYLQSAAASLGEDARAALSDRSETLKNSLSSVNREITKTQDRLASESDSTPAGKADAAALAALTAQQANLVLQIDQVDAEAAAGSQPVNGQAGGGAKVIQRASPATSTPLVTRAALFVGLGALVAFLLAATILVLRGRRERTLRSRDEIADAVGIPVIASIRSRAPRSVGEWTGLLRGYAPEGAEMWTLRRMLRMVTPGAPGSLVDSSGITDAPERAKVVVVTLPNDRRALALGPQLASFAASTGQRTHLVTAVQHESGNRLWAACASVAPGEQPRTGLTVASHDVGQEADLTVYVAVIDREPAGLALLGAHGAVTLLAVTSGAATPDDVARAALAADDAGHPVSRVIVVDPDPLDRTTGRLLPTERSQHVPLPSLMTGAAAGDATPLEAHRSPR